ncbi:MAG: hypothetical protein MZW92_73765 [Comamonadaceae bacterium]|nr:hypothetical protein [Comamonadaceae bacterium]
MPPFDGYLAGLLHDTGWLIAWRVVDRAGARLVVPPTAAFAAAIERARMPLFGRAARRWAITPGLSATRRGRREHGAQASG